MSIRNVSQAAIIGLCTVIALVGIVVLSALTRSIPDVLPAIGLSGLAALAGLSMPSPASSPAPAPAPAPATAVAPAVVAPAVVAGAHEAPAA